MALAVDPEEGEVKGPRSHVATTRGSLLGATAEPGMGRADVSIMGTGDHTRVLIHSKRTCLVTSLVTRLLSCNALQPYYNPCYKEVRVVIHYKSGKPLKACKFCIHSLYSQQTRYIHISKHGCTVRTAVACGNSGVGTGPAADGVCGMAAYGMQCDGAAAGYTCGGFYRSRRAVRAPVATRRD